MIIRYISDIHLEFIKPNKIRGILHKIKPNQNEICVLAGDIGNPFQKNYDDFMNHIDKSFKHTFIITGNHEYYNKTKTIEEIDDHLLQYFQQFSNITFLNNSIKQYNNHCFIGTTLWSKVTNPTYEISDMYQIPNLDYLKYNRLNMIAKDFLENAIKNNDKCIVITHHMPSQSLIHPKYMTSKMRPYNQWFYCDMDELIKSNSKKISAWIYGHTHMSSMNTIHKIPFLCNPIGYPGENAHVNFEQTIKLE